MWNPSSPSVKPSLFANSHPPSHPGIAPGESFRTQARRLSSAFQKSAGTRALVRNSPETQALASFIKNESTYSALKKAAIQNDPQAISDLVIRSNASPAGPGCRAIQKAAELGNTEALEALLLSSREYISLKPFNQALFNAVKNNHGEAVGILCKDSRALLDDDQVAQAVEVAYRSRTPAEFATNLRAIGFQLIPEHNHGGLDSLRQKLVNPNTSLNQKVSALNYSDLLYPPKQVEKAIKQAARLGNLDAFNQLFDQDHLPRHIAVAIALYNAVAHNAPLDAIESLSIQYPELEERDALAAAEHAIVFDNWPALEALTGIETSFNQDYYNHVLKIASSYGKNQIVQNLLNDDRFLVDRGMLFSILDFALSRNNETFDATLREDYQVVFSPGSNSETLRQAIVQDPDNTIGVFLEQVDSFYSPPLCEAIRTALVNHKTDTAQLLFSSIEPIESAVDLGIELGQEYNTPLLLKCVLQRPDIHSTDAQQNDPTPLQRVMEAIESTPGIKSAFEAGQTNGLDWIHAVSDLLSQNNLSGVQGLVEQLIELLPEQTEYVRVDQTKEARFNFLFQSLQSKNSTSLGEASNPSDQMPQAPIQA